MKQVLFYTYPPNIHTMYSDLLKNPPEGYEFIVDKKENMQKVYSLNKKPLLQKFNDNIVKHVISTNTLKDHYYAWKKLPEHNLILSTGHLCLRKEQWVLDMPEQLSSLTGYDFKRLKKRLPLIVRTLRSEYCKAIIIPAEGTKRSITHWIDDKIILDKIHIVPYSIDAVEKVQKRYQKKMIFLFIGSANIVNSLAFYMKGGHMTIAAFNNLDRDDCELWIISHLPEEEREICEQNKNIKLYPVLPRAEVFEIYEQADALIQPAFTTPAMGFLEAFSFAVPVITVDLHINAEIVEHMETGLVAKADPALNKYYNAFPYENVVREENFNEKTILEITDALKYAADHRSEIQVMGRNARKMALTKFSYAEKKKKLKEIFDYATNSNNGS